MQYKYNKEKFLITQLFYLQYSQQHLNLHWKYKGHVFSQADSMLSSLIYTTLQ